MWKTIIGLLAGIAFISIGVFFGKEYFGKSVTFITQVERMRNDITVTHERDITTYYHVCPEKDDTLSIPGVTNRPPKLFLLFPSTLKFKLSLKNLDIKENQDEYIVKLGVIEADNPYIDTTKISSIVIQSRWATAEERYEDREKRKATNIIKYITLSQLKSDRSIIKERMEKEVLNLLTAILKTNKDNIKPIKIFWDDAQQEQYVENEVVNLPAQPPFDIVGCEPYRGEVVENRIVINGITQTLDTL